MAVTEVKPAAEPSKMATRKKYPSLVTDGFDPLAGIKLMLPLSAMVGAGFLVAAFLPRWLSLLVAAAAIVPHLLRTWLRSAGVVPLPELENVTHGRMAGKINGDFCVFLLGIRNNAPVPLNSTFKFVAGAYLSMIRQLEADPEKYGFLGTSNFTGTNWKRGSHILNVMYWRSYEDVERFARDTNATHWPAWKAAQKVTRASPHIGLWHEAFNVRGGDYHSIYVNCPPLGLGHAGYLVPAGGKLATSAGRNGHSEGTDRPKEAEALDLNGSSNGKKAE